MCRSTARPIIAGATSAAAEATMVATNAMVIRWRSPASSGSRRASAVRTVVLGSASFALLSVYGFVVTGASLRVINLHVFRTALEQLLVGACGQHLAFHQHDDLV